MMFLSVWRRERQRTVNDPFLLNSTLEVTRLRAVAFFAGSWPVDANRSSVQALIGASKSANVQRCLCSSASG